jgi:2-amino-4-hydroxy-6-hydroxymethyldihydropteridine diphosphokinase
MKQVTAYIGLGSNLGDRRRFISDALKMLEQTPGIEGVRATKPTETIPLGGLEQPKYLNSAAEIKTSLSAQGLHKRLKEIEDALGRKRGDKWASRTIDLDLLLFGNEVIKTKTLTIPHPETHLRAFVLADLCKLNTKLMHPILNETVGVLANRLRGNNFLPVKDKVKVISIAGNIGAGKTTLARGLVEILGRKNPQAGMGANHRRGKPGSTRCELILEKYDTNPFLAKVYAGDKELALDSQLYFLTSRVEQLSPEKLNGTKYAVTDYVFPKELIYANILLSKEQRELYCKIYKRLVTEVTTPAILLYLADSPEQCLKRIHNRNRPYEQKIKTSFLERIDAGYKKLTAEWNSSPVITLKGFNCLNKKEVKRLSDNIKYYLNPPQAD